VNEYRDLDFDMVVIVCDSAADECPVWLPIPRPEGARGEGKCVHHSFYDPVKATETDDEIMTFFRKVRDDIEREIIHVLSSNTH
jgi:arsenate reductase